MKICLCRFASCLRATFVLLIIVEMVVQLLCRILEGRAQCSQRNLLHLAIMFNLPGLD